MKGFFFSAILLLLGGSYYAVSSAYKKNIPHPKNVLVKAKDETKERLRSRIPLLKAFAKQNNYSTRYIFLADMKIPSGRKRFFIYDLERDSVIEKGLVAHGSCNTAFLESAEFSDLPGCGCSAEGKYKIGYAYNGRFGKAFKLFGLDSTNKSSFERYIVFHSYSCVPDHEVYPEPICNSLGCAMVSLAFLDKAAGYIESSPRPILLYIFR
jgi:hypothetical protein